MQVEFLNQGAEHVITVGTVQVPVHVERDQAQKIVNVGIIVKFAHTTPGGKSFDWTTGIWLSAQEFRNVDGSPKTKLQIATALRDKAVAIRTAKQTEWDALDAAVKELLS